MCNITREKFIIFYRDRIAPTHFVFIPYVIIIVDNEKKNMCRYKKYLKIWLFEKKVLSLQPKDYYD